VIDGFVNVLADYNAAKERTAALPNISDDIDESIFDDANASTSRRDDYANASTSQRKSRRRSQEPTRAAATLQHSGTSGETSPSPQVGAVRSGSSLRTRKGQPRKRSAQQLHTSAANEDDRTLHDLDPVLLGWLADDNAQQTLASTLAEQINQTQSLFLFTGDVDDVVSAFATHEQQTSSAASTAETHRDVEHDRAAQAPPVAQAINAIVERVLAEPAVVALSPRRFVRAAAAASTVSHAGDAHANEANNTSELNKRRRVAAELMSGSTMSQTNLTTTTTTTATIDIDSFLSMLSYDWYVWSLTHSLLRCFHIIVHKRDCVAFEAFTSSRLPQRRVMCCHTLPLQALLHALCDKLAALKTQLCAPCRTPAR
jgi:hypothetical protein